MIQTTIHLKGGDKLRFKSLIGLSREFEPRFILRMINRGFESRLILPVQFNASFIQSLVTVLI